MKESPRYFKALEKELESYSDKLENCYIHTIYIGGGTPSLVNPELIRNLLSKIHSEFNINSESEISIEANPESITQEKLDMWLESGVNRISIGLQAWQNHHLKKLNRLYSINEFIKKIELTKKAGFSNFNIDLIFALPDQSLIEWKESVEGVLSLRPNHISCYSLELDNDSYWGKLFELGKFKEVEQDVDRIMYKFAANKIKKSGYEHYEISNFALPNFRSQHNNNFWKGEEYVGLGSAAHSYLSTTRFHNIYNLEKYTVDVLNGKSVVEIDSHLKETDVIFEYLMLRLRLLKEGLSFEEFKEKFGFDFESKYSEIINKIKVEGLIKMDKEKILLTKEGVDKLNLILSLFL